MLEYVTRTRRSQKWRWSWYKNLDDDDDLKVGFLLYESRIFQGGCIFMFDEQMAVVSCRADGDNDFIMYVVEYLVWNHRRRVILCDITFIYMPWTARWRMLCRVLFFCLLHSILWYVHHAKKCFRSVNKMHAYGRGYVVINLAMCCIILT
jgi:hypothetical protein